MSPHNFSRKDIDNYIHHPNFVNTPSGQTEKKVEMFVLGVIARILTIPAAFTTGLKKITKGRKKSQKSQGIPNNLFEEQSFFEE